MTMILLVNLDVFVNNNLFHAITRLSHDFSMPRQLNNEVSAELCGKS